MVQKYLPREDHPNLQQLDLKHQSQVGGPSVEFLIGYAPPLAAQRATSVKHSKVISLCIKVNQQGNKINIELVLITGPESAMHMNTATIPDNPAKIVIFLSLMKEVFAGADKISTYCSP